MGPFKRLLKKKRLQGILESRARVLGVINYKHSLYFIYNTRHDFAYIPISSFVRYHLNSSASSVPQKQAATSPVAEAPCLLFPQAGIVAPHLCMAASSFFRCLNVTSAEAFLESSLKQPSLPVTFYRVIPFCLPSSQKHSS